MIGQDQVPPSYQARGVMTIILDMTDLYTTGNPNVPYWIDSDLSKGAPLGSWTGSGSGMVNITTGANTGRGCMTMVNGDRVFYTISTAADGKLLITFVGGTGRYEKASGSGICTTTENIVATQGKYQIRTWSYAADGTLTY
jgi:hypothetical protein